MNLRKRIISALSVLVVSGGMLAATAHPASAQTNLKIYNSSASDAKILVYKTDGSWSQYLNPGQETGWINNTGSNPLRVNLSWSASYKIGVVGQGYGPCHNGYNPDSNPPDDAPDGVRYRNWNGLGCV